MPFKDDQQHYSESLDQSLQSMIARFTNGISPAALMLAFQDWYSHLSMHPAKQMELLELMQKNMQHLANMNDKDKSHTG
jgi:polyhydroxyalkanoate synthase